MMANPQAPLSSPNAVLSPHLVYFLIPLPDVLHVPDDHHFAVQRTVILGGEDEDPYSVETIDTLIRFHQIQNPLSYQLVNSLFELASKIFPNSSIVDDAAMEGPNFPPGLLTVAEVAVPCALSDESTVSSDLGDDIESDNELSDAFDLAIRTIRQYQRANYLVKRIPMRLVARQNMPFAIPYGSHRIDTETTDSSSLELNMGIFLTNKNIEESEVNWGDSDEGLLQVAIDHQFDEGFLSGYLDLDREAKVAWYREGNARSAVIFIAAACESLLDDLLKHLLWEDGQRPEDCASLFDKDDKVSKRVKSHFSSRLRGQWSLDSPGPVADWFHNAAELRNRAVHTGYEPSDEQVTAAFAAATRLVDYIADRVTSQVRRYPRTANVIPGREGLIRRNCWTKNLQKLTEDPSEPNWIQTFARWRAASDRLQSRSHKVLEPSVARSYMYCVLRNDVEQMWVVHDRVTGLAARVSADKLEGLTPEQKRELDKQQETVFLSNAMEPLSVYFAGVTTSSDADLLWIPEYHLVPLANVMVDGSDLDQGTSRSK